MGRFHDIATNDIMTVERVYWQDAATSFPDDDELVLLYCPDSDEPVWPGYWNGMEWLHAEGGRCEPTFWATMLCGPTF